MISLSEKLYRHCKKFAFYIKGDCWAGCTYREMVTLADFNWCQLFRSRIYEERRCRKCLELFGATGIKLPKGTCLKNIGE